MRAVELDERLASQERGQWSAGGAARRRRPWPGTRRSGSPTPAGSRWARRPTWSPSTCARRAPRAPGRASETAVFAGDRRRRGPRRGARARWSSGAATGARSASRWTGRSAAARGLRRGLARRGRPRRCTERPRCVLTDIGELTTHDPAHGDGRLHDAALVVERRQGGLDRPAPGGAGRGQPPTTSAAARWSPASSTRTATCVFAGDRAEEFAARMTGTPYSAGGIRTTVAATRAATDEQLAANLARLVDEMHRQGTTTVEVKSGYGLTVHDEARGARPRPPGHRRDHLPRRARGAAGVRRRPGRVRRPGDRPDAGGLRALRPVDRRVLRDGRLRRRPGPRGARRRRAPRGCAAGCTPTSSARARACGWPASSAWPPSTTAPTSPTEDVDALAGLRHDRDAAARRGVLDPLAVPGRPRACSTPACGSRWPPTATPGRATPPRCRCASRWRCARWGCLRPRRWRPPRSAGRARSVATTWATSRVGARADLAVLDAPSYLHLAYRPGVPLVREVLSAAAAASPAPRVVEDRPRRCRRSSPGHLRRSALR